MGAGFQVFNESGNIQIDADYNNYVMTGKGTLTTANSAVGYTASISSGKKNSIFAFRGTGFAAVFNSLDSAGNVVHNIMSGTTSVTLDWWVFAADPPGASNNGFEVYNSVGQRVFQGTEKYLKLLRFDTTSVNAGTNGTVTTPNKYPAFVSASFCALWEGATVPIPGGGVISQGILRTLMGNPVSGGAQFKSATIYEFGANRGTSNNAFASFFLIDVDNL